MNSATMRKWKELSRYVVKNPVLVAKEFELFVSTKQPVPPYIMSLAISAYGRLSQGLRILDIMEGEVARGAFVPQLRHMNNLMNSLGRSNEVEAALVLYQLIITHHRTDTITLISVIDILSRTYHVEMIKKLWKDWMNIDGRPLPNINLYTSLGEAFLRARNFDLFQESELESRSMYHQALFEGKWSKIAILQTNPKHCVHISTLLRRRWFPLVSSCLPSNERLHLSASIDRWVKVRAVLPGAPLTKLELEKWEQDVDLWIAFHSKCRQTTKYQNLRENTYEGDNDYDDEDNDVDLFDDTWLDDVQSQDNDF